MTHITFLPHKKLCPKGKKIQNNDPNISLLDLALSNGIPLEHACDKVCACTTCQVYVRKGFDLLEPSSEIEDDLLDKAWGLEPDSRLSCQIYPGSKELEIELPLYTLNLASEG